MICCRLSFLLIFFFKMYTRFVFRYDTGLKENLYKEEFCVLIRHLIRRNLYLSFYYSSLDLYDENIMTGQYLPADPVTVSFYRLLFLNF